MTRRSSLLLVVVLGTVGCMVGPNYRRPDVATPPSWGELAPTAPPEGRSDAIVEAAEDDRNAVLVSLMAEVGLEYVTYRSLQQRIALANQNVAAQQGTLDLTRRLFNAGLAPELDVQRAAAQVATTASTIPLLEQQAAQAMHVLSVLIGQPPMALEQELAAVGPIPKPPAQVAVGLPSELLLRRPDVARSERQLASQTAQIGVAARDLFPRFFISGAASLQSVRGSDFFDWESRLLSLGPSVSWPIFEGGRIRANIALQTAAQQELLAAYEGVVLQAFQDVEDALVAFSHEQATRAQLEEAVRANQRAAELARNLYGQGLTDFLTVLVAEQSVFTSQDTLAQTERDVALELVALYKAVGGGWEPAPAIKEDLVAERVAIETYRETVRCFGDRDPTTRVLLERILAQEEEHANDMHDLLVTHEGRPMLDK